MKMHFLNAWNKCREVVNGHPVLSFLVQPAILIVLFLAALTAYHDGKLRSEIANLRRDTANESAAAYRLEQSSVQDLYKRISQTRDDTTGLADAIRLTHNTLDRLEARQARDEGRLDTLVTQQQDDDRKLSELHAACKSLSERTDPVAAAQADAVTAPAKAPVVVAPQPVARPAVVTEPIAAPKPAKEQPVVVAATPARRWYYLWLR